MSCGLALAMCIVGIISSFLTWIPIVSIFIAIPEMIIGFLFTLQMKNAILAIMDYREKPVEQIAEESH
jgi:hypothetical protein